MKSQEILQTEERNKEAVISASGERILGLCEKEVKEQIAKGNVNHVKEKSGKSYFRILTDNLLTFFNLVWALVAVVLIAFDSFSNLTFLFIIIPNILIATILEMRAKRTVEKLSVTTETKAVVIRDGVEQEIDVTDIVLGDIIKIELGKQVLSDAEVISGYAEANESMLTGESVAVAKRQGDIVLAGSYLVGGSIYARVIRVGSNNYVHKIEKSAKGFKTPHSNLFRDLNRLIKVIGIFMVPMAAAMFLSNHIAYSGDLHTVVTTTCGSIIGMIPAGIYLLVTLTLTLSVIKLSKKHTLVQDMYSIEMLASADVICLDKTGTITDGTMCVDSVEAIGNTKIDEINRAMALIEGAEDSQNNTSKALIQHFGKAEGRIVEKIPFSSSRKYSAIRLENGDAYAIGAPSFVPCSVSGELEEKIRDFASEGLRVLLLAKLPSLTDVGEPMALITISGRIRPSAKETIESFQSQDVKIKIISGDHAATVSNIAKKVGVNNAEKYISCENISDEDLAEIAEDYVVFGRVTPEQKVLLIKTLKSNGHTVAMTGDGVNDTLALKESNCAIAMAEGSEVAKKVSQIVLLNSDFSTLPDVVREGRRCINNVRGSAVLFLMKTVFTILLSIFAISTFSGYPFQPKQFMLLELFVIGAASFLLALEPNNKRITGTFLRTVLVKSVPLALVMFIPVLTLMLLCRFNLVTISDDARNSLAMIMVTTAGFINLISVCRPFTKWRAGVCALVGTGIVGVAVISIFKLNDMLAFLPAFENTTFLFAMIGVSISLALFLQLCLPTIETWVNKFAEKLEKNKKKKKRTSAK